MFKISKYNKEAVDTTTEFGKILYQNFHHFVNLQKIANTTMNQWRGCGGYMMDGQSLGYCKMLYPKQKLFFDISKKSSCLIEVGVHAAHSLLIALIANPDITIHAIDICIWNHTEQCIDYLNKSFNNRITFYKGGSLNELPKLPNLNFDFIHIDGDHRIEVILQEINLLKRFFRDRMHIIFDDITSTYGLKDFILGVQEFKILEIPECESNNCLVEVNL